MTDFNLSAFEQAGFTVVTAPKVDYADEAAARDYLRWGFKPREQVEKEAVFAVTQMGLPPGASVLDIGCGNGVAAVKLARMGYRVTGLDISPVFLEAGRELQRETCAQDDAEITWVCEDFFACSCPAHDAALLFDPGLEVPTDAFIAKLTQVVKPGGRFFLRYKSGLQGTSNLPWSGWSYDPDHAAFHLERHGLDRVTGMTCDEWIALDFVKQEVIVERLSGKVALFSTFVEMMAARGLTLTGAWGDVKGAPVTENSRVYAAFRRQG
jgi:SAM-dependent methyltransferase